jgi:hypothetical protein
MTTSILSAPTPPVTAGQQPRLLDQVAAAARQRGASEPTTSRLVSWVRPYVLFHGKRHPRDLDRQAVGRFLEHVLQTEKPPLPALERGANTPGTIEWTPSPGVRTEAAFCPLEDEKSGAEIDATSRSR